MAKTLEHSKINMLSRTSVDVSKWDASASEAALSKTVENLKARHISAVVVDSAEQALEALKQTIPAGADVMNGSSTTLAEIGFLDLLKSDASGWKNRHETILSEADAGKQADLRRLATAADYFVSGAQAVTQQGDIVGCDASGSRVGAWLFSAKHVVIVAGTNKIVPDLSSALSRIREFAFPLENERAKLVYNMGSNVSKIAVLSCEFDPTRTTLILVREKLGY